MASSNLQSPVSNPKSERGVTIVTHPALPLAPRAMEVLERLSRTDLLAYPPVALPDLHLKPLLETRYGFGRHLVG
jgi:hypothetical protein